MMEKLTTRTLKLLDNHIRLILQIYSNDTNDCNSRTIIYKDVNGTILESLAAAGGPRGSQLNIAQ